MPIEELEILQDIQRLMQHGLECNAAFIEDEEDGILLFLYRKKTYAICVAEWTGSLPEHLNLEESDDD
jgi:hypothetical protein